MTSPVFASEPPAPNDDTDAGGQKIYAKHCAQCHGDHGQGSNEYEEALLGDRSIGELAKYIEETMPEDDPDLVVAEESKIVAKYIHEAFYSPAAQRKRNAARVELSRLTVRQYQESIADLTLSFGNPLWIPAERGLQGTYFASRRRDEKRQLSDQLDPTIDFADGVPHFEPTGEYKKFEKKKDNDNNRMAEGFSAFWSGSIIAPETGKYQLTLETQNGFEFNFNNEDRFLIDRMTRSDTDERVSASVFMLGGRAYPISLRMFAYPDPPAKIRLLWTPPTGQETLIPQTALMPEHVSQSLAISTSFPADDASAGYQRGVSVSQQWDQSTTDAAIETANWIDERIWRLAKTKPTADDRDEKVKNLALRFVERAFVAQLTESERQHFVDQHFENDLPVKDQLKRVIILALKSPRFLYPSLQPRSESLETARQISLLTWDSIPDDQLFQAGSKGKLTDPAVVQDELYRLVSDPRAKSKLKSFFHYWLKTDKAEQATKDSDLYPDFDNVMLSDLRYSLDLYLDDVVWSEKSDFRQLFLADYLFANERLANFYGLESGEAGFTKIDVDPEQRAGILTHPYLMAGLAYHKDSSPIHRGVFIARNLLGRSLRQPPDNVEPLTEEFNPEMTNRQRVEHQTKETACMNCHSVINPLGFSLENFDAVGRFRTEEKKKPIDVSAVYTLPTGESVELKGARDLANFLANDKFAQRSFVAQVFHHYAKQSIDAYGPQTLDELHQKFVSKQFHIRELLIDINRIVIDFEANRGNNKAEPKTKNAETPVAAPKDS